MSKIHTVLNIPDYYIDVTSNIQSDRILPLFKQDPIDYMRTLYSSDSEVFYHVRDELILRGIGFQPAYQNNFLLGCPYTITHILYKEEKSNAFQTIDFSLIGANNFIERFDITSDLFFNGIPLEGLLHFTTMTSEVVVRDLLEKAGFSIIPVQSFSFPMKNVQEEQEENYDPLPLQISMQRSTTINAPPKETTIEQLFTGTIFTTFHKYCEDHGIKTFSQLSLDFVWNFEYQKHIRKKSAYEARNRYEELDEQFFHLHSRMDKAIHMLRDNPFKHLLDKTEIDYDTFLNAFYEADGNNMYSDVYPFEKVESLEQTIIQELYENIEKEKKENFNMLVAGIKEHPGFVYVEDSTLKEVMEMFYFEEIDMELDIDILLVESFKDLAYTSLLEQIKETLEGIQRIDDVLDEIIETIEPRNLNVLAARQTRTLREVGEDLGLTRERVRQIQVRTKDKIITYNKRLHLNAYIHHYSNAQNKLLSLQDFMDYYQLEGNMYEILLRILFDAEESITFVKEAKLYVETNEYALVRELLEEIGMQQPIIDRQEIKSYFSESEEASYLQLIDLILEANKYKRVNTIYVKQNISIIARINYLFENMIEEPLEMNDEGYAYFQQLMKETFGVPFKSSKRAATARIADGENVILTDWNTFFYHHTETITDDFLQTIEKLINEQLLTNDYADPRYIYKHHSSLMERTKIASPVHLYSIIQIYLDDKYETGQGNTLYVYKGDTERLDAETILLNYLISQGHVAHKDTIMNDLKWKEHKLDQLLTRIDSSILIGDRYVKTTESFNFNPEETVKLVNEVTQMMEDGYVFTYDLQFELAFNEQFKPIIEKYELANDGTLVGVLKHLMPKLQGHSKLLYWCDSPIVKLEQVISNEHPNLMTRREMIQYIEDKGYSSQTIAQMHATIIREKLFYYYTTAQYINANQLHFSDEVKGSLATYLTEQMKETIYKSVFSMVGFTNELAPISKHPWTEWLINHFAEQVGFKQVQTTNDYRYDKLILVKEEARINHFDELILHILETEYSGRYHAEDLARFLEAKNLLHNPRQLPSEIYESDYFEFDSFGFFEVGSKENVTIEHTI